MKTLYDIKQEYARENGCKSWRGLTQYDLRQQDVDEVAKRYAYEIAKEALKNAVQSAARKERSMSRVYLKMYEAIESETNIPKELL